MKKFFGTSSKSKTKTAAYTDESTPPTTPGAHTPIHAAHAVYQHQQSLNNTPNPSGTFRQPQHAFQPLRPSSLVGPDHSLEDLDGTSSYDYVLDAPPPPSLLPASRTSSYTSLQGALPPGASPPAPNPVPNTNSPTIAPGSTSHMLRKKAPQRENSIGSVNTGSTAQAPGVLGLLKALDPSLSSPASYPSHHAYNPSSSDLHQIPPSGRETPMSFLQPHYDEAPPKDRTKWSLFSRNNSHADDRERDRDRRQEEKGLLSAKEKEQRKAEKEQREERERHWQFVDREREEKGERPGFREERYVDREKEAAELTRMIGYLTATASEDWALVLEVCERASSSEGNAKEAVRALRREFKYGPPSAQLSAARLWAIMLRNSSNVFITQCTSKKFLDTLEDLLTNTGGGPFSSGKGTSPVVRERVMDVLAAAAYASGSSEFISPVYTLSSLCSSLPRKPAC